MDPITFAAIMGGSQAISGVMGGKGASRAASAQAQASREDRDLKMWMADENATWDRYKQANQDSWMQFGADTNKVNTENQLQTGLLGQGINMTREDRRLAARFGAPGQRVSTPALPRMLLQRGPSNPNLPSMPKQNYYPGYGNYNPGQGA